MAIFTPGAAVGQISGRVGGYVFSHNRGGPYIRNGSIPTKSTSAAAMAAKQRLEEASMAWQALTADNMLAWQAWAQQNPVTNRLGNATTLTGHQAYVGIYCRLDQAGQAPLDDPPVGASPAALATVALTLDIGAGDFQIAYTATPLGADEQLELSCAVVNSAGVRYVQNVLKLVTITDPAQASPYDFQSDLEDRFGTLQVGQAVVCDARVFDHATGLLSAPVRAAGVIVST